ncbi:hypothetical protein B0H11DRAFT_1707518, partial [Mycena galericulata]
MSTDLRRQLRELNAQIASHRRLICDLERRRDGIERKLDAEATFPVITLPAELTSEIFVHCVPDIHLASPETSYPRYQNMIPIVLQSVCRRWRDIAFRTPRLW